MYVKINLNRTNHVMGVKTFSTPMYTGMESLNSTPRINEKKNIIGEKVKSQF